MNNSKIIIIGRSEGWSRSSTSQCHECLGECTIKIRIDNVWDLRSDIERLNPRGVLWNFSYVRIPLE